MARKKQLGTTAPSRQRENTKLRLKCPFQIPKYGEGLGFGKGTECLTLERERHTQREGEDEVSSGYLTLSPERPPKSEM